MSIPTPALLAISDSFQGFFVVLGALTFAMVLAGLAGVFLPGKIAGPGRMRDGEPLSTLWMLVLIGLGSWMIIPSLYAAVAMSRNAVPAPTTSPTTLSTTLPATTNATTQSPASSSPEDLVWLGLLSAAGGLLVIVGSLAIARPGGFTLMGFNPRSLLRAIVPGLLSVVIVLPFIYSITALTQWFWNAIGYGHPDAHPLLRIFNDESMIWLRVLIVISAVVLAPPFEELLFRGLLQTAFVYSFDFLIRSTRATDPSHLRAQEITGRLIPTPAARWAAIGVTSVLFALVHPELWMMPPIFVLSLCLGYAYERSGNLWVSIILHASFNAANVILFVWQGT